MLLCKIHFKIPSQQSGNQSDEAMFEDQGRVDEPDVAGMKRK